MKMKDILPENRPYEKFERYGMDALTNQDLLAILLRTGTKTYNVFELAACLLEGDEGKHGNLSLQHLYRYSYEQLREINGIGKVKALQIMTLLELSKRLAREKGAPRAKMTTPKEVAQYFMEDLRHKSYECFIAGFLDAKCRITGYEEISKGSLTASVVHPREVYRKAIQKSAYSIIVLHNHPSGDPTPSQEDLDITKRLKAAGTIVGIPLLDHIIIGDGIYRSLKEESYL